MLSKLIAALIVEYLEQHLSKNLKQKQKLDFYLLDKNPNLIILYENPNLKNQNKKMFFKPNTFVEYITLGSRALHSD